MSRLKTMIVLTILAVALAGSFSFARAEYREDFSKTLPLKAGDTFSLENVNGTVTVATWKEAKVEIKAVKVAKDDEKDLKDVEIRVEESAGSVRIKAVWPKFRRHFNVYVDFDVKVPEGVNLRTVETVNGDVEVTGVFGAVDLETTNGGIRAEGVKGEFRAETTNGGVTVSRVEGKVVVGTTNGNIKIDGLTFKDSVEAETTNGSITLRIENPDQVNAALTAETTNGHVEVDFPVTLKNLSRSRRRIEAQIGQGGPEISLMTTNGSISIEK